MKTTLFLLVATLYGWALQREDLRVHYENGVAIEQLTDRDVTVMVSLVDTGKLRQLKVCLINNSGEAITVSPDDIRLHQTSPKDEEFRAKSERELKRSIGHGLLWKELLIGIGAGLSRDYTTVRTNADAVTATPYGYAYTYGSAVTTVSSPNYELQARWFALGDQIAAEGASAKDVIERQYLRRNTVFPETQLTGTLWFRRDKALQSGRVEIALGSRTFEFPFPPPSDAKAPAGPLGDVSAETANKTYIGNESARFGMVAKTSEEAQIAGAEILYVTPDGPADSAGLQAGYVVDRINGNRLKNISDLNAQLAKQGPGERVRIGYLFRTNLGWMGAEKIVAAPESAALKAKGSVLGISGTTFQRGGIEIVQIDPDSPASLAGLHVGDVITSVDGHPLQSSRDLGYFLAEHLPGSRVKIDYVVKNSNMALHREAVVILGGKN